MTWKNSTPSCPRRTVHIERHFREHWSLYEYDTAGLSIESAEAFISHINTGGDQGGPISWRYTLLDPSVRIPSTSLLTMCEVWHAICCCIQARTPNWRDGCFRLSVRLVFELDRVVPEFEQYDGYFAELDRWRDNSADNALAAWVDLLVKASRGAISEVQAPERLRPVLAQMADRAIKAMSDESADPDEKQFLARVQQPDRDLVWDHRSADFGWAHLDRSVN